jgi:hypothetical protein
MVELYFHSAIRLLGVILNKTQRKLHGLMVLRAVTVKSTIFWDATPRGLVDFTDVSEERTASIIRTEDMLRKQRARSAQ